MLASASGRPQGSAAVAQGLINPFCTTSNAILVLMLLDHREPGLSLPTPKPLTCVRAPLVPRYHVDIGDVACRSFSGRLRVIQCVAFRGRPSSSFRPLMSSDHTSERGFPSRSRYEPICRSSIIGGSPSVCFCCSVAAQIRVDPAERRRLVKAKEGCEKGIDRETPRAHRDKEASVAAATGGAGYPLKHTPPIPTSAIVRD